MYIQERIFSCVYGVVVWSITKDRQIEGEEMSINTFILLAVISMGSPGILNGMQRPSSESNDLLAIINNICAKANALETVMDKLLQLRTYALEREEDNLRKILAILIKVPCKESLGEPIKVTRRILQKVQNELQHRLR